MIEIRNKYNNKIIILGKYESIKDCLEKNIDADLKDADLRDADLRDADLRDADLRGANLRGANLIDADLRDADLKDADLKDADLRGADLRDADLKDADLRDANLRGADLRDANLIDANLIGADLRGANLIDANLIDADLRGAKLRGAKGIDKKDCTLNDYIKKYNIKKKGCYIFAYKGVTHELKSPIVDKPIYYEVGKKIKVEKANPDYYADCGAGINLCPTIEQARDYGDKVIKVKVDICDIVVIPHRDEKFRVKSCEVIEVVK